MAHEQENNHDSNQDIDTHSGAFDKKQEFLMNGLLKCREAIFKSSQSDDPAAVVAEIFGLQRSEVKANTIQVDSTPRILQLMMQTAMLPPPTCHLQTLLC